MGSHWTCCTPEEFPEIERSDLFSDAEWRALYDEARKLFHTNSTAFDDSIRQQLVKKTLREANLGREFISLPLACQRNQKNKDYVEWTASATILGNLAEPNCRSDEFELKAQHRCTRLVTNSSAAQPGQIEFAELKNLLTGDIIYVKARKYVICAGAILTPGILFNSGFTPASQYPALVWLPHTLMVTQTEISAGTLSYGAVHGFLPGRTFTRVDQRSLGQQKSRLGEKGQVTS